MNVLFAIVIAAHHGHGRGKPVVRHQTQDPAVTVPIVSKTTTAAPSVSAIRAAPVESVTTTEPNRPPPPQPMEYEYQPTRMDIALGGMGYNRAQHFRDDLFGRMVPFDVPMAPAFYGELEAYPGAFVSRSPWVSMLGVFARGEYSVPIQGRDRDGTVRGSAQGYGFSGGVRARYATERFDIGISGRVAWQHMGFTGTNPDDFAQALSVDYLSVGGGANARVKLVSRWALFGGAEYRALIGGGAQMKAAFPRASGGVVDAQLGVAFQVFSALELRAQGNLRYYHLSFAAQPGDNIVVGGGTDIIPSFALAAAVRF